MPAANEVNDRNFYHWERGQRYCSLMYTHLSYHDKNIDNLYDVIQVSGQNNDEDLIDLVVNWRG